MLDLPACECTDWLRNFFRVNVDTHVRGDTACEVSIIYQRAKAAGFSRRLVRLAKNRLRLVVTSAPGNDGKRVWYWRLP